MSRAVLVIMLSAVAGMSASAYAATAESPLEQWKNGTPVEMIQCPAGMSLMQSGDGRPVCVSEPTSLVLLERGYVLIRGGANDDAGRGDDGTGKVDVGDDDAPAAPTNPTAPSDGERTILKEQIVHKVVDGVLVVEKEMVEAIYYPGDPAPPSDKEDAGDEPGSEKPTKITQSLQERIDSSESTVPASIMLEYIAMWPNGWPDPNSYPTVEQRAQRGAEKEEEARLQQEPVIAFLEENDVDIIEAYHGINVIRADVPVSLIPALEQMDVIKRLDNYDIEVRAQ